MTFLHDLLSAYRAIRRARAAAAAESAHAADRAARDTARAASLTDAELLRYSIQHGGATLYPELRRRGLPLPGQ